MTRKQVGDLTIPKFSQYPPYLWRLLTGIVFAEHWLRVRQTMTDRIGPAMSGYRSEASSRSAVKTELTSARLNGSDYQRHAVLARCLVHN